MKKILMAVVAVVLAAVAGTAVAATTDVVVQAEVAKTCRFNSASTTINLGALPIDGSGNAQGTSQSSSTTFWCTKGVLFSITDDDGLNETGVDQNQMKSENLTTPEYIAYTFTYSPTSGTGKGPGLANYISLNYTVTVPGNYANNSADTYSDKVVVTITP